MKNFVQRRDRIVSFIDWLVFDQWQHRRIVHYEKVWFERIKRNKYVVLLWTRLCRTGRRLRFSSPKISSRSCIFSFLPCSSCTKFHGFSKDLLPPFGFVLPKKKNKLYLQQFSYRNIVSAPFVFADQVFNWPPFIIYSRSYLSSCGSISRRRRRLRIVGGSWRIAGGSSWMWPG